jgi:phage-related protein
MVNLPYKIRALLWLGDSKESLSAFPRPAKRLLGFAIRQVQNGLTPDIAVPLTSFGSGVYELKAGAGGEAYRVVYVIKLRKGIYVVDAFQKKSKSGKAIPREIRERIEMRLAYARRLDTE